MKLGPTGKFPRGKLDKTDEGALRLAVHQYNGTVRVDFGSSVRWFALPPRDALKFATLLVEHAEELLTQERSHEAH